MKEQKFISKEKFIGLVGEISKKFEIFYPKKQEEKWDWARLEDPVEFSLDGFRTILPIKYFFYSPQENLIEKKRKPRIVMGARGCDTRGLSLLSKIYLDDPEDPYFRKDVLIFSSDCTSFHQDCFCTLLGDKPWAEDNYDLNFSAVSDGYLVQVGSDRGRDFLIDNSMYFVDANPTITKSAEQARADIEKKVKKHNGDKVLDLNDLKKKVEENEEVFKQIGKQCMSCSACTNICPACFCFFLSEGDENKIRYIDSCQIKSYARVAGGANPRSDLTERFKHRFCCKFAYRPDMHGFKGCTGCGRCISGCQGKISFKEVLLKLGE